MGFADGTAIDADMIVVAAGIRPNIELARRAGLVTERGIVVDDQMRCEDEGSIFAVGECAQHRSEVYGLVAPGGAGGGARRRGHRSQSRCGVPWFPFTTTKLQGGRRGRGGDGCEGSRNIRRQFVQFYEPKKGIYKASWCVTTS